MEFIDIFRIPFFIIVSILFLRLLILIIKNRHFRDIIDNEQVFKLLFEENEVLLWSGRPYFKTNGILHIDKRFYLFLLIIAVGFSIIISLLLYPTDPNRFINILTFTIYNFYILSVVGLLLRWNLKFLVKTEYFFTNKRVLSIRKAHNNGIERKVIVNYKLNDIDYFFFEQKRTTPPLVYNMYFKVFSESEERVKNSILIYKPLIDKITKDVELKIEADEGLTYKYPWEPFVRFKRVLNKEDLAVLLSKKMSLKEGVPTIGWKKRKNIEDIDCPY